MGSGKKLTAIVVAMLVASGSLVLPASAATYESSSVDSSQTRVEIDGTQGDVDAELAAALSHYDVPQSSQNDLIQKFHDGVMWDSIKEGSNPVSSETHFDGSMKVTVERYPDGSVAVSSVTIPAVTTITPTSNSTGVTPLDVSGCQVASSNHYVVKYVQCYGEVDLVFASMGFSFDYTSASGSQGVFDNYYGMQHFVVGSCISNEHFVEVSTHYVQYAATAAPWPCIVGSWTAWMGVQLGYGSSITLLHN